MIDTHCHLDDAGYTNLEAILHAAQQQGVSHFIIPAADPKDLAKAHAISHQFDCVYFAVGVHPNCAGDYDEQLLRSYITDSRCVAVGECGLDYYRLSSHDSEATKQLQKEIFAAQIRLAIEFELPLILHIREASADVLQILRTFDHKRLRGVLHCFNADSILLELSETFYYGIGGVLTFKNARRLVQILPQIPRERLLLETDAPYLTPEPHRGTRNSPVYIPLIAQKMAEILQTTAENISTLTDKNADILFGLRMACSC